MIKEFLPGNGQEFLDHAQWGSYQGMINAGQGPDWSPILGARARA